MPPTRSNLISDDVREGRRIALQAITDSVKDFVVPLCAGLKIHTFYGLHCEIDTSQN
jgi:hypothetical protein